MGNTETAPGSVFDRELRRGKGCLEGVRNEERKEEPQISGLVWSSPPIPSSD